MSGAGTGSVPGRVHDVALKHCMPVCESPLCCPGECGGGSSAALLGVCEMHICCPALHGALFCCLAVWGGCSSAALSVIRL